jgi:hypothetical protein
MRTEVREINPTIAKEMLKRNFNNRKLNETHIRNLSNQMKLNNWLFDGTPLKFDKYGRLLDGQHRLNAVIESNKQIKFLILTDIETEAFKVMDTGRLRSSSDVLSIMNIKYPNDVAYVARQYLLFDNGKRSSGGNVMKISNTEVVDWYNQNLDIINFVSKSDSLCKKFSKVLSRGQVAFYWYLFHQKNVIQAEDFIYKLCDGIGIDSNSPVYILRKRLFEDRLSNLKLSVYDKKAIIIKAWNLYRKNKPCRVLRFNKSLESFPEIL